MGQQMHKGIDLHMRHPVNRVIVGSFHSHLLCLHIGEMTVALLGILDKHVNASCHLRALAACQQELHTVIIPIQLFQDQPGDIGIVAQVIQFVCFLPCPLRIQQFLTHMFLHHFLDPVQNRSDQGSK